MALFIGIAKPNPAPGPERTRVLIPITSPKEFNNGPPELPGLIAASVWMRSILLSDIPSSATSLFRLLIIP